MDFTEMPKAMDINPVHPENVLLLMDVTESGMTTDVNPVHPENA